MALSARSGRLPRTDACRTVSRRAACRRVTTGSPSSTRSPGDQRRSAGAELDEGRVDGGRQVGEVEATGEGGRRGGRTPPPRPRRGGRRSAGDVGDAGFTFSPHSRCESNRSVTDVLGGLWGDNHICTPAGAAIGIGTGSLTQPPPRGPRTRSPRRPPPPRPPGSGTGVGPTRIGHSPAALTSPIDSAHAPGGLGGMIAR